MAECSLDSGGLRRQGDRYAAAGRALEDLERQELGFTARFGSELDEESLQQALAIERECCPFFAIEYEPASRRLDLRVPDAEHAPALDAIASALRG